MLKNQDKIGQIENWTNWKSGQIENWTKLKIGQIENWTNWKLEKSTIGQIENWTKLNFGQNWELEKTEYYWRKLKIGQS